MKGIKFKFLFYIWPNGVTFEKGRTSAGKLQRLWKESKNEDNNTHRLMRGGAQAKSFYSINGKACRILHLAHSTRGGRAVLGRDYAASSLSVKTLEHRH